MKVYVIKIKNGIMMDVSVNGNNYMIRVLVKMIVCGILVGVNVSVIRHVKLKNIYVKIVHAKNIYLIN